MMVIPHRCRVLWYAAVILVFCNVHAQVRIHPDYAADWYFNNGKIFTADESQPWADALVVRRGRVLAAGAGEALSFWIGPQTQIVDLGGRLMTPGFNDAHAHSFAMPEHVRLNDPATVALTPGPTVDEIVALLAERVAETPPGAWIFGTVGTVFLEDGRATRDTLDAVAPDHPVWLLSWAGHGTVLNSLGLEQAGFGPNVMNPAGGHFGRDDDGRLNGRLNEYAENMLRRRLKSTIPLPEARRQYAAFAASAVSTGVTSVQDMDIGYRAMTSRDILWGMDLPLRWRMICFPLSPEESCATEGRSFYKQAGRPNRLAFHGEKFILDGSPVEGLAATREPYADNPENSGWFLFDQEFKNVVKRARKGVPGQNQLLLHSVGDLTTDRILAELTAQGSDDFWRGRRVRLEHGALLWPDQLKRMAELGVVFVHNPIFSLAGGLIHDRYGPERVMIYQPTRSALDAGVPLAMGSDTGGAPGPLFVELWLAVTHPANPAEAITMEEAVKAYTLGSAYAEFREQEKGSLTPGKFADLVVLSQDLFSIPADAIPATQVHLTMVGGQVVYSDGVIVPR